ncbi:MAG: aminomethyl-transferring glycine dehydrogenase subunit GcvPB [Magnetococcales bacterium]|nr:aminomethyl-transferring glycine dehydrogenase subunit GcvPB [Magnetococcales bacterium]
MSDFSRTQLDSIFAQSVAGRCTTSHWPDAGLNEDEQELDDLPATALRSQPPLLPELSELQVVRHFTRLSQRNYAIDSHFYPLGSCTMKYNPRICHTLAMLPGFLNRHPLLPDRLGQGVLSCLHELQQMLCYLTGMAGFSLAPMAGAQGEFAGVAMIRAYHRARGDLDRCEMIIPSAAHGTNPATASLCGFGVREIPVTADGDVDLDALRAAVGPKTAGLMLTNPSTLGVFERRVEEIAAIVHQAGGLLYYDGANLNAIVGRVRPGDMGFDAVHVNTHKTFATPHGGGGPGAGPIGVNDRLLPFLPLPLVGQDAAGGYRLLDETDRPQSMGRVTAFTGNIGVLLRAYVYLRLLAMPGLQRVSTYATLNANYLMERLRQAGFQLAYPQRRATHEFIVTLQPEARQFGVTALHVAKRLLDYGCYAPTIYFPSLVPECLLIEPTETENREELDRFAAVLSVIRQEAISDPERVRTAPHHTPVQRLDETRAARQPDLVWRAPTH